MEYRFILYVVSIDTEYYVTPQGFSECSLADEQHEGQLFYRRIFKNPLIFTNPLDWAYFKNPYDLGNYCEQFGFYIEKRCSDTDDWAVDWSGSFSLMNGKFDFDRCTYTVIPIVLDKYSNIIRNSDDKINLLTQTPTTIVSRVKAIVEVQGCTDDPLNMPCDFAPLQSMTSMGTIIIDVPDDNYVRVYAREAIVLPSDFDPNVHSSNWVQWDGNDNPIYFFCEYRSNYLVPGEGQTKWVRNWTYALAAPGVTDMIVSTSKIVANYVRMTDLICGNLPEQVYLHFKATYYPGYINEDVELSYRCYDLLDSIKLLSGISTIDSEFFTNATNPVTGVASKTNHLYLIQNSDAKRPSVSNPATKGEISFNELMTWLQFTFRVFWDIDSSGHLQLFHESEVLYVAGLNLSNYSTADHMLQLEFDLNSLYEQEKITIDADNEDFEGLPILYDIDCVSTDKTANVKEYVNGLIMDLPWIQTNSNDIPDEGFTLVATDDTTILIETGEITGTSQINGHLSVANLMHNYWQHERVLINGTMNGVATTFQTIKKTKIFNEVSIILCCTDEFDPVDEVVTALGNGRVANAEYNFITGTLKLNLLL
jgi:hypothetical protein